MILIQQQLTHLVTAYTTFLLNIVSEVSDESDHSLVTTCTLQTFLVFLFSIVKDMGDHHNLGILSPSHTYQRKKNTQTFVEVEMQ